MFVFSNTQLLDLTVIQPSVFKGKMMGHLTENFPAKAALLGAPVLERFIDASLPKLARYGIRHMQPASIFADIALMLGTGFDEDPLWTGVSRFLLQDDRPLVRRLTTAYEEAKRLTAGFSGDSYPPQIEERFRTTEYDDLEDALGSEESHLRDYIHELWPEKLHSLPARFSKQYNKSIARAAAHKLREPGSLNFYALLAFLFGLDFDTDPQYDWMNSVFREPGYEDEYHKLCSLYFYTQKYLESLREASLNHVNND